VKKQILMTTAAAIAAAGLTAVPAAAAAQEDGAQQSRDVITVTARRREETILDAPVAVTAFGEEDILNLGLQSVDDVARFTPGLSFSAAFGRSSERPVIRGQANVLAGVQFGVESGTAYFIDGLYFPGSIQTLDPNDLARVEVIRGPQSALYGRNTYAGAINFVTRGPTDTFQGNFRARAGSHGEYELTGGISGPIGDRAGFRLSVRDYNYDGEWTNQVTGQTVGSQATTSFSGVLDFRPFDTVDIRLRAMHTDSRDGTLPLFLQPAASNNCSVGHRSLASWPLSGSNNQNQYFCGTIQPGQVALNTGPAVGPVPQVPGVPPTAIFGNFLGLPFLPPFGPLYGGADGTVFDGIANESLYLSGTADWDIGASGYVASLGVGYRDEDRRFGSDSDHSSVTLTNPLLGPNAFFANTTRAEQEDVSIELKINSPADQPFRWMAGVYHYNEVARQFSLSFPNPDVGAFSNKTSVTNQAIFGLVEFDFTPELTVTLEARYSEERKSRTEAAGYFGAVEYDNFTPRLTINWQPDELTTIFAVYAQGTKAGGVNGPTGAPFNEFYDQESSNNYEIGIKRSLFGGAGYFAGSLYFIDASDVQLTTPVVAQGGAINSVATNQGAAEIWGLELEYRQQVTDMFSFGASYAWTQPEFTSGCDDAQWELTSGGGVLTPGSSAPGTGTSFFGQTGNCSIAGNRIPLTSEHQFSVNGELRAPFGTAGAMEWFVRSDLTYESSKYVQVHNLAQTGDATLLGAQIGLQGENWTLLAYGRNMLDEDSIVMATRWLQTPYFTFASPNTAPAGATTGAPRAFFGTLRRGAAYGVEARYHF